MKRIFGTQIWIFTLISFYNYQNIVLFTLPGWEDPPLADDGVEDAKNAGRLLRRHGFEFDVVYTSWLTRAIQTAWYVMDELDMLWLPMVSIHSLFMTINDIVQ